MPASHLHIVATDNDFRSLRRHNRLYVDKTARIVDFLHEEKYQLFTRPRRFGKSLLLSTIEAMYSGNRDLFRGDGIRPELDMVREEIWHWPERVVLRLDMLMLGAWQDSLIPALNNLVTITATQLHMRGLYDHDPAHPAQSLASLIVTLSQQATEVQGIPGIVVLVDEYDAPILNRMHSPQGQVIRQNLAEFYGIFKALGAEIETLVMTGVTRFVKTGMWSTLNQVVDQSEEPRFHDLIGFTDTELDVLWERVQDQVPAESPRTRWPPVSRTAWREWYNGYRFTTDAAETLYNPFAIMRSLTVGAIGEYWAQAGHLGVVEQMLQAPGHPLEPNDRAALALLRPTSRKNHDLPLGWLDNLQPGASPEAMLAQWEPDQLERLLYQTGYLTLTPTGALTLPNREITTYLRGIFLDHWLAPSDKQRGPQLQEGMVEALLELDIPRMVDQFNALLRLFPHQYFPGESHSACNLALNMVLLLSRGWSRYHEMEKSSQFGDADATLVWDDIALVLEFKTGTSTSIHTGQRQIRNKGYLQAVPRICRLYLGLSLHTTGRQVDAWMCQGYTPKEPVGKPLTDKDAWPPGRAAVLRQWAIPTREAPVESAS